MRYLVLSTALIWAGCRVASSASGHADDLIVLEGTLSMRGPEPHPVLVLETNQRNLYVLNLDALHQEQETLAPNAPMRARVTGTLYRDLWNGQAYAFLRVITLQDLDGVEHRP